MSHISIKARLTIIMGFMVFMMVAGGGMGLSGIVATNQALEDTYRNRLEPTKMIGRITLLMNNNRAQIMLALQHQPSSLFLAMHDHPVTMHTDAILKNRDEITAIVEEYRKRELTPKEKTLSDKYADSRAQFVKEGLMAAREAILSGDYFTTNKILLTKVNPLYQVAASDADALLQQIVDTAKTDYETAKERYQLIRNAIITGTLLSTLLATFLGVMLIRSIVNPLSLVIHHFRDMAAGNLNLSIQSTGANEIGKLMTALAEMQGQLRNIVGRIIETSGEIQINAHKLNGEMSHIVEHSETQRSRVLLVAAAMEEVSQSITEVASNAGSTANTATESQGIVSGSIGQMAKSLEATTRVVDAVQSSSATIAKLSQSIQRIGEITNTIKDIADQTNLLALNAAIEAARAGDQGRGFAVVADEVRKLAERTAVSTTDISQTVSEVQTTAGNAVSSMERAVHEVEEGISLMQISGKSLDQITTISNRVAEMAQHIAVATRQQSIASVDVARNMEQISMLIDKNTGSAQVAWKMTEDLDLTAETLKNLVGSFRCS